MRFFFLPKDSILINALKCCANCNKESEPFTLKMCPECRTVHYCNDDCQQADRENHQHQCNKDAEELKEMKEELKHNHTTGKENTDNDDDNNDKLFQPIPPKDDCPICSLPLPIDIRESIYLECCGKVICDGCNEENVRVTRERGLIPSCAFCREPTATSENEDIIRLKKRMEGNDCNAIFVISQCYKDGKYAFELCLRAAKLGHSGACHNVAAYYKDGVDVDKDMTKARKYNEMAVKKGHIQARYNLGADEWNNNNNYRLACRHLLISAAAGDAKSLEAIAQYYQYQLVTKEEYSTALTSYSNVHKNEYSVEREVAAAADAAADETKRQNSSSN